MTNESEKNNCGKQNITFNNYFYENRADYEIMCKNIAENDGVAKAAATHSECVILIAFSQKERFRKRALVLRLYVHNPSCLKI
jgi:hypothetical protein